jgi:hypothetical protein
MDVSPAARRAKGRGNLLESGGEYRVVSCFRSEWETEAPDLAGLLARAVPGGASRHQGPWSETESTEDW